MLPWMYGVNDGFLVKGKGITENISEFHVGIEAMTSIMLVIMEVMGSVPSWNSEIFSVVTSPITKQPSFTKY